MEGGNMVHSQSNPVLKEAGTSLVGLLVSLAVAGILIALLAQTVETFLQTSATEKAVAEVNAKNGRLVSYLTYSLHNAGFGLPSLSGCPGNALIGHLSESTGAEYPVSADAESSSQYGSTPPGPLDTLTVMYMHSITGSSVMARIVSLPSTESSVLKSSTDAGLAAGDGFVMDIPGKACLYLTATGVSGNSRNFVNWEFNHSNASNPPNGVASLLDYMSAQGIGSGSIKSSDFTHARLLIGGVSTMKTLYLHGQTLMGHFITTGSSQTQSIEAPVMQGVLAFRVLLGTGNGGQVTQWMTASDWQGKPVTNRPAIMAVRLGWILVSTSASAQIQTPATLSLMGSTYTIPAKDNGHIVQSDVVTLPVENNIWTQ